MWVVIRREGVRPEFQAAINAGDCSGWSLTAGSQMNMAA